MFNALIYLLLGILLIACFLMVLIVLMQRPKNEGLGAAFGGGMTQDLFGAQTTNVLQKFTVYLGIIFFAVSLTLTVLYSKTSTRKSAVQQSLQSSTAKPKAKTPPAPVPIPAATASAALPAPTTATTPVPPPSMPAPVEAPAVPAAPAASVAPVETAPLPASSVSPLPAATVAP